MALTADQLLAQQRTTRRYEAAPPSADVLRECVAVAQRAPSTSNHQPYCVITIEDASLRQAVLAEMVCQPYVFEAPALMLVCVDWSRQDALAEEIGMTNGINRESKLVVGVADASIFAHTLALALQARGLGVSYVASPYTALAAVARKLHIPPSQAMPLHLIAVGHPAEAPPLRPRYPLEAILHRDQFRAPKPAMVRSYLQQGSQALEREGYFEVTGDPIANWREHYMIKFGEVARARTWDPLARDLAAFLESK